MLELTYHWEGDYLIPDLDPPEAPQIGKYGTMRHNYLWDYHTGVFDGMLLTGRLNAHLDLVQSRGAVKRALTAYSAKARKDPGEAFTLEPGTRIVPLCSDGQERMWFETDKGKGGVLLLVPDEEDMWLIDGTPEADCFEELPYSG